MLQDDYFSPVISILLDDKPRKVLLDTGGFWSIVTPQIAAAYPATYSPVQGLLGLHNLPMNRLIRMPSVQIGPAKVTGVEFLIAPDNYFDHFDGTLGANWLSQFDVEIDPVKNTASLFSHEHCEGRVIYWPHQDYAAIPFTLVKGQHHVTMSLTLDGKEVKALIDTGAPESVVTMAAAKRLFGLTPDSPGMEVAYRSGDANGRNHPIYRYKFSSLEMGDIAFKNPRMTISDTADADEDMILGMHQLHGLHLYFAYDEHMLYVTTARGDIAAAGGAGAEQQASQGAGRSDPLMRINARNYKEEAFAKLQKGDRDGALAAANQAVETDGTYSDAFLARADIHASRGEREPALKDFARAIELNPDNLDAYAGRSQFEWEAGDKAKAITDIGLALHRNPDFVRGYLLRAAFELDANDRNAALADAGQLIRAEPGNAEGYSLRAQIYETMGDYSDAYEDETAVVRLTPKSAAALNGRCWFGAILGKLDDALDDCNAALEIAPKSAAVLDSRGYVRLKRGQWDRAVGDYSNALLIKPDLASSLYGRGLAKQQKGDKPGADADIAAAQKIDTKIAEHFGK
jgi:tetratricopeptide (TPR) repeat protein/predicted aspartyl protease